MTLTPKNAKRKRVLKVQAMKLQAPALERVSRPHGAHRARCHRPFTGDCNVGHLDVTAGRDRHLLPAKSVTDAQPMTRESRVLCGGSRLPPQSRLSGGAVTHDNRERDRESGSVTGDFHHAMAVGKDRHLNSEILGLVAAPSSGIKCVTVLPGTESDTSGDSRERCRHSFLSQRVPSRCSAAGFRPSCPAARSHCRAFRQSGAAASAYVSSLPDLQCRLSRTRPSARVRRPFAGG